MMQITSIMKRMPTGEYILNYLQGKENKCVLIREVDALVMLQETPYTESISRPTYPGSTDPMPHHYVHYNFSDNG